MSEKNKRDPYRAPTPPKSCITTDQVWEMYQNTRIGDRVKFVSTDGYSSKAEEVGKNSKRGIHGVVLDKFPYHCLVEVDGHRECFLWVEMIMNKWRKEDI